MTGLEPHPIWPLPTIEQIQAAGAHCFPLELREKAEEIYFKLVIGERRRRMEKEKDDPFQHGYESPIWHLVDDLLVDGNRVVIDLARYRKISPEGMMLSPEEFTPREIIGCPEIWIGGSNRSSKSEYGVKKIMKVLDSTQEGRTWSFADTGPISVARQQPVFWRYLPITEKRLAAGTGKMRQGAGAKITYSKAGGFAGETFVLMNLAQHWFKNYAQDIENMEGDQLDAVLLDELRNVLLLKTLRGRMGDRGGLVIVSFTSIDENYSDVVDEYDKGSTTILEVPAELLPLKDATGEPTGRYEMVPRIKIAGRGSDGDQRANIVYFHITDNAFYGYEAALQVWKKTGKLLTMGKERFYKLYRQATKTKILARVYGLLSRGNRRKFPEWSEAIHVIEHADIPRAGTNYQIVDPCDGRNWFMLWIRIDPRGRWFIYREWPSHSTEDYPNPSPSAYVPGIGDPGPWALPGGPRVGNAKPPEDGARGPAQSPMGFGLSRYKMEILRCEGARDAAEPEVPKPLQPWERGRRKSEPEPPKSEEITDRFMDSRYGATPTTTQEGQTTLIEQMADLGMDFKAASGKDIVEGIDMIHELLDYDREVPLGQWSARLARINAPRAQISRQCPNLIYALQNWTGRDKGHGACKDGIDCFRYAVLADLDYIGADAYSWVGGGVR